MRKGSQSRSVDEKMRSCNSIRVVCLLACSVSLLAGPVIPSSFAQEPPPQLGHQGAQSSADSSHWHGEHHGTPGDGVHSWNQSGGTRQLNLDLSSTVNSVMAPNRPVSITVGGSTFQATPGSMITPAQRAAMFQVMRTGQQSLVIGADGNAIGGSLSIGSRMAANLSNLVIPQGVTAITNAALGNLNITGNLTNIGTLLAISSNSSTTSTSILANNIFNSGLISSLPNALTATQAIVTHLDLNLIAHQSIINTGQILSSGAASLVAGTAITNTTSASQSALIQALGSINLSAGAGAFVNSGVINSIAGNINFNAPTTQNILVNNLNGTLQALGGSINVRDASYSALASLSIQNGNLSAQAFNLNSGYGNVQVSVDRADGVFNIVAGNAVVAAATNELVLGSIKTSADPAFYNTLGDVTINGDLQFNGADLAIVAAGNVLTGPGAGKIDTSSTTGNAGAIRIIAGAKFTASDTVVPPAPDQVQPVVPDVNDFTITLNITGASDSGGKIDLSSGSPITLFTSSTSGPSGQNAGNVALVAFGGKNADSGTITLPANLTIEAGAASVAYQSGDVAILAGAAVPAGTSSMPVSLGNGVNGSVDTRGGTGGGITIQYAQPEISAGGLTITGGTLTGGHFFGGAGAGPVGTVATGDITVSTPSGLTIISSSSIEIGNIKTNGANLAVVSGKDISGAPGGSSLDTSSLAAGGAMRVYAGLNLSADQASFPSGTGMLTSFALADGTDIMLSVSTGGSIDLSSATKISSAAMNGTSGALQLVALAGSSSNSGIVSTNTSTVISADSNVTGATVTILGTNKLQGNSITTGPISNLANSAPALTFVVVQAGLPIITGLAIQNGTGLELNCCSTNTGTASIRTGAVTSNGSIVLSGANVFVDGDITIPAVFSALTIGSSSINEFQIGPGAAVNGINGVINASGAAGRAAAAVDITNTGTGGINVLSNAIFTQGDIGFPGSKITLSAPTGPLTLQNLTLNVSGNVEKGGVITLVGAPITIVGHVNLDASGCPACITLASGGQVSLTSKGHGDLRIGGGSGEISISIRGLDDGDNLYGGGLSVTMDGNLTVHGPSVDFTGGQSLFFAVNGKTTVTGSLGSLVTLASSVIDVSTGQIDISGGDLYANLISYEPPNFPSAAGVVNLGTSVKDGTFSLSSDELANHTHASTVRIGRLTNTGFSFADSLKINVVGDLDLSTSQANQLNFYTLDSYRADAGSTITLRSGQTLDIVGFPIYS